MKRQVKSIGVVISVLLMLALSAVTVFAYSPAHAAAPAAVVSASDTQDDALPIVEMILASGSIIWLVTGLVSYIKKLGVKGAWLTVSAMVIGIIFGVAYQYFKAPLTTFGGWFLGVCFGLGLGLIASGVYDTYGNKTPEATSLTTIVANTSETGTASAEDDVDTAAS